ncbi:MAG: hypothetical protein DME00_11000 [Candidatus Rokuibacteriota bacterium]|nr:MAG: hypothetical protein DME00_11000 [Candidatus Rokubacteria bacterium]
MGTLLAVTLAGDRSNVPPDLSRVFATAAAWERVMSRHAPTTPLARLNRRAGDPAGVVSRALATAVGLGRELAARTGGAFDPTIAPLAKLWQSAARRGRRRESSSARADWSAGARSRSPDRASRCARGEWRSISARSARGSRWIESRDTSGAVAVPRRSSISANRVSSRSDGPRAGGGASPCGIPKAASPASSRWTTAPARPRRRGVRPCASVARCSGTSSIPEPASRCGGTPR